jgi:hypothetical protein
MLGKETFGKLWKTSCFLQMRIASEYKTFWVILVPRWSQKDTAVCEQQWYRRLFFLGSLLLIPLWDVLPLGCPGSSVISEDHVCGMAALLSRESALLPPLLLHWADAYCLDGAT